MKEVRIDPTFPSWQAAARWLLRQAVPPDEVRWTVGGDDQMRTPGLPDLEDSARGSGPTRTFSVPRRFVSMAESVARHPDPERWALLYRVLWRLVTVDRRLLELRTDGDVSRLLLMDRQVQERGHEIDAPAGTLFAVAGADRSAQPFVPTNAEVARLREAATSCTGCDLYKTATQVVFGRGPADARLMLVGEQPGDQEDLKGEPFVGPAGEVLDRALAEVGLARSEIYVTNAVKHFKWEPRGKRRLHQKPTAAEMQACRPWLEAELAAIKPELVVCLGATAAQTLMGPEFRVLKSRGRPFRTPWAPWLMATIHPSAVLRAPDPEAQEATYRMLVEDLRKAAEHLRGTNRVQTTSASSVERPASKE